MPDSTDPLDALVEAVLAGAKYRSLSPDLARAVAERELGKGRSRKEAIKATRSKLHQVVGAYMEGSPDYEGWLAAIRGASEGGDEEVLRAALRSAMRHHASTRERLPILDEFYAATLGDLPPVRSVVDVACGLNPLAIPWMPLAPDAEYRACDVEAGMVGFLNAAFPLMGIRAAAHLLDATRDVPPGPADLALLLKAIPCLEQLDKSAGERLLDGLEARHILVSFPVRSLGGRSKGMPAAYDARMRDLLAGRPWSVERFPFATELAFLITKRGME